MKKAFVFLAVAMLLIPAVAFADSPFDGTWRMNMQTAQVSAKPEVRSLDKGVYSCTSGCDPIFKVKADGTDQKVTGSPYFDAMSVKITDNNTVETTYKKNGKPVGKMKEVVSADGKQRTAEFEMKPEGVAETATGKATYTRQGEAKKGAHAVTGSWTVDKFNSMSDNISVVTYKTTADGLTMKMAIGDNYDAKFDGKDYPYQGNPGFTHVSLKKIDANTIEETDKRDGKVVGVSRMSVSPDGKKLNVVYEDKVLNATYKMDADKQ